MKRIIACVAVLASVLVAPPARGQTSRTGWTADGMTRPGWNYTPELRVEESAGEVEVRFTSENPGRFHYYTDNGDCHGYPTPEDPANETPLSPDECGRPFARASEDYVAVRGELTFSEPGSRTVRIPIIDDDLDETDGEAFTIWADESDDTTDGVYETGVGYNLYIYIGDDDPKERSRPKGDAPHPVATTMGPSTASEASLPAAVASPADLELALPTATLEPGPGFELVIESSPEPASERDDRTDGAAWLPLGLATIAVGSGGAAWLRRLRRWSPTRS